MLVVTYSETTIVAEVFRDIETMIFDPVIVFLNHIDEVRNPVHQVWSVIKKLSPQSLSRSQHLFPSQEVDCVLTLD